MKHRSSHVTSSCCVELCTVLHVDHKHLLYYDPFTLGEMGQIRSSRLFLELEMRFVFVETDRITK